MSYDFRRLAEDLGIKGRLAGNQLYARCPFHHDRRPSFALNVQTGQWLCFSGCGHGAFDELVQKSLSCSLKEAAIWTIEHGGLMVTGEELVAEVQAAIQTEPPEFILSGPEEWRRRYIKLPRDTMPIWLFARGFSWQTVDHWDIRWDAINQQIVIPVRDANGKLVGTVSRNSPGHEPKYLNSPGLPRHQVLFGLQPDTEDIILVEGPLDAIWLNDLGFPGVALLGLDLSIEQVGLLRSFGVADITLAFDADQAGRQAEKACTNSLVAAGWLPSRIKVVDLPAGAKDVQECTPWQVGRILGDARQYLI